MLRVGKVRFSEKTINRTREKSQFNSEVEKLGLKVGEFAYVSHLAWLESLGDKAKLPKEQGGMSKGSLNNGPRYSLKRNGFDCVAVLLSGKDLKAVADSEGRELKETDIIYSITPTPEK